MAGRGPAPKDPSKRVRRGGDQAGLRVIVADPTPQPELPELMPGDEPWPTQTRTWWRMWAGSPLAEEFTANDWSELLDTALLHGAYWSGKTQVAAELRLRVAKFGATPEDRARLKIVFAIAEKAEAARPAPRGGSARDRYTGPRAVGE